MSAEQEAPEVPVQPPAPAVERTELDLACEAAGCLHDSRLLSGSAFTSGGRPEVTFRRGLGDAGGWQAVAGEVSTNQHPTPSRALRELTAMLTDALNRRNERLRLLATQLEQAAEVLEDRIKSEAGRSLEQALGFGRREPS
jgi:hypothetical protein